MTPGRVGFFRSLRYLRFGIYLADYLAVSTSLIRMRQTGSPTIAVG